MRYFAILISLAAVLFFIASPTFAAPPDNPLSNVPERSGLYDDPDHPGIKVRVIVHPEKPNQTSNSVLVCSLDDPDSSAVVSPEAWHLPSNWTYNLNPSSVPSSVGVGSSTLSTMAGNGFADWSSAISGKVNFLRGTDTSIARSAYDSKNIIAWGRTQGTALGVTYIRYYTSSGLAVDVDTIMNKKFSWKWSNSNSCAFDDAYDAENVLTHEIGHWLGLDDEYDVIFTDNTMFGYADKGEVKKNTLTTGDILGAQSIYP
ncbi:matrixin family metalloprotease [Candidatus Daviesbacteria bacterium]|nr:matrixin family metalloprotease [Candidatus Daviesbacteria bacterium]MBI4035341.1 matrixin family metalloprotease [Candidatus Daviesbacteria bacterium]